jgi:hypothetical protein
MTMDGGIILGTKTTAAIFASPFSKLKLDKVYFSATP